MTAKANLLVLLVDKGGAQLEKVAKGVAGVGVEDGMDTGIEVVEADMVEADVDGGK